VDRLLGVADLDDAWPEEGSTFRHVIGLPPLAVPGSTTATHVEHGRRLDLRAGMGPLGAAEVSFRLFNAPSGGTHVEVHERFVAGPAGWTWRFARPVAAALVWGRNAVSLDALADHVDGTASTDGSDARDAGNGPDPADDQEHP